MGQTERVGSVSLLGGNHPAARPLFASINSAECHTAYLSVPVHCGDPHIQAKSGVICAAHIDDGFERNDEMSMTGQIFALSVWVVRVFAFVCTDQRVCTKSQRGQQRSNVAGPARVSFVRNGWLLR